MIQTWCKKVENATAMPQSRILPSRFSILAQPRAAQGKTPIDAVIFR